MNIELSPDETLALAAILASLSERAKQPLSLEKLMDRWRDFVIQVEQGYEYSIYEYVNDLSTRDLLKEIFLKAPWSLRKKLSHKIQIWDNRFQNATREVKRPLISSTAQGLSSWWFRIPRKLGEELAKDLQAEGMLE